MGIGCGHAEVVGEAMRSQWKYSNSLLKYKKFKRELGGLLKASITFTNAQEICTNSNTIY